MALLHRRRHRRDKSPHQAPADAVIDMAQLVSSIAEDHAFPHVVPRDGVLVRAHPVGLREVVLDVVAAACHRAEAEEHPYARLELRVTGDTVFLDVVRIGEPLEASTLLALFRSFRGTDGATLLTAQRTIERWGGVMGAIAASQTTFWFRLPRVGG